MLPNRFQVFAVPECMSKIALIWATPKTPGWNDCLKSSQLMALLLIALFTLKYPEVARGNSVHRVPGGCHLLQSPSDEKS